jgi:glycosyltransferase involved in cell wall biosynthesis
MSSRPLISFVLGCFNQEQFIREAVGSALAQTYSPLEIIVSDDCSRDRTFQIVEEIAATYRGPHALKLNRNPSNLGIGGNVTRALQLCSGQLILVAAGDDVSLPERTEELYQAWERTGRPTSVCSSYVTISSDGQDLGPGGFRGDPGDPSPIKLLRGDLYEFLSTRKPVVCGCSHAWTPELFAFFGPLNTDLEDLVVSFRSLALSTIAYVQKPLVKYRRHGNNVSFFAGGDDTVDFEHRERRLRWVNYQKGRIPVAERDRLKLEAKRIRDVYAAELQMMEGNFLAKIGALFAGVAQGNFKVLRFAPRLFPLFVYRQLYRFVMRTRAARAQ